VTVPFLMLRPLEKVLVPLSVSPDVALS
jgi:hypothetical protein